MAELTLTIRVKLATSEHESKELASLCDNYTSCCNDVSDWIGEHHTLSQKKSTRLSITHYATSMDCWPR